MRTETNFNKRKINQKLNNVNHPTMRIKLIEICGTLLIRRTLKPIMVLQS